MSTRVLRPAVNDQGERLCIHGHALVDGACYDCDPYEGDPAVLAPEGLDDLLGALCDAWYGRNRRDNLSLTHLFTVASNYVERGVTPPGDLRRVIPDTEVTDG